MQAQSTIADAACARAPELDGRAMVGWRLSAHAHLLVSTGGALLYEAGRLAVALSARPAAPAEWRARAALAALGLAPDAGLGWEGAAAAPPLVPGEVGWRCGHQLAWWTEAGGAPGIAPAGADAAAELAAYALDGPAAPLMLEAEVGATALLGALRAAAPPPTPDRLHVGEQLRVEIAAASEAGLSLRTVTVGAGGAPPFEPAVEPAAAAPWTAAGSSAAWVELGPVRLDATRRLGAWRLAVTTPEGVEWWELDGSGALGPCDGHAAEPERAVALRRALAGARAALSRSPASAAPGRVAARR